jgi:hypothetical protein
LAVGAGKGKRASRSVALICLLGLVAAGCIESRPGPDRDLGGVLDSRTHEAGSMRHMEERQEQNRASQGGVGMSGSGGGARGY